MVGHWFLKANCLLCNQKDVHVLSVKSSQNQHRSGRRKLVIPGPVTRGLLTWCSEGMQLALRVHIAKKWLMSLIESYQRTLQQALKSFICAECLPTPLDFSVFCFLWGYSFENLLKVIKACHSQVAWVRKTNKSLSVGTLPHLFLRQFLGVGLHIWVSR